MLQNSSAVFHHKWQAWVLSQVACYACRGSCVQRAAGKQAANLQRNPTRAHAKLKPCPMEKPKPKTHVHANQNQKFVVGGDMGRTSGGRGWGGGMVGNGAGGWWWCLSGGGGGNGMCKNGNNKPTKKATKSMANVQGGHV